ncbi:MAG: queuosine precursor transporter [Roseibium album]|uniref:Probable queuosine precursor transporter n=1 Tax=Roseibium album TaxID=311410 RepID=A0A0M7A8P6_9HYPH|nr:queuosine precursor transporter [Roseibium album]MBG6144162.1 putative integral membrane protein (TIGR00697 family) [Labrenzia sp. EL_142]MBG6157365.1 putative integral membrane protein (TIGR00697 family) [Labrenzia sp. EL_162]MBG6162727.1 putative integral membrane protein (TIGR00697 family) [Labrenzia sp. EL_195]MBG6174811.1 putative integral membrane protein (TIGR00697 family) [Labrenzia sp. EL_132]MBG6196241.1 putative integral membrane protein (TIGR00697 family) [Labrenzia sp. EL_159]
MTDTRSFSAGHHAIAILAMALVVAASNYLVQFPVEHVVGGINLADTLTWGAFTYPIAFLVTDLTNRRFGPVAARKVVVSGFILAIVVPMIFWAVDEAFTTPRILIASGTAFLVAQLLDVTIFDKLRRLTWWKAPMASSLIGSVIDTLLFFGIAFSASFAFVDSLFGMEDGSLAFPVPFLGIGGETEVLLWMSLAVGDLMVKILVALALLAPYRIILNIFRPVPNGTAA